jgi:hypothetical protein
LFSVKKAFEKPKRFFGDPQILQGFAVVKTVWSFVLFAERNYNCGNCEQASFFPFWQIAPPFHVFQMASSVFFSLSFSLSLS